MPSLLLMRVSLSHCTPVTRNITSISSHLHLGIDPQTSARDKLSNVTKHSSRNDVVCYHLIPVRFGTTTYNSSDTVADKNNTVTWLTQHIGNAQEWGGIWPPSLQTPIHIRICRSEEAMCSAATWGRDDTQTCYNVAPVETMPTLKRGVVLCWVGTMFFM